MELNFFSSLFSYQTAWILAAIRAFGFGLQFIKRQTGESKGLEERIRGKTIMVTFLGKNFSNFFNLNYRNLIAIRIVCRMHCAECKSAQSKERDLNSGSETF